MKQIELEQGLRRLYGDIGNFSEAVAGEYNLRLYQLEPARAIIRAVQAGKGGQFALIFSRQAGKDETLAQILAYLLNLYQYRGGQIVMAAPTSRQVQISRDRLLTRLDNTLNTRNLRDERGYIVGLGKAEARFLSAAPTANVRGETASLLLVANECQDILPERWDAVFDPMAASTNAVTLFSGTVWTARTLLARQMRHLRQLEAHDGQKRIFLVDWREVARYLPAYGERVAARIAQFGPMHPFIRTEYYLQELDGAGGLFNPTRRALMQGSHPRQIQAAPGKTYCLLIDVAGGDETGGDGAAYRAAHPRRDSTVCTVVEVASDGLRIDKLASSLNQKLETRNFELPVYRVVQRYVWTGVGQAELYERIIGLARECWKARYIIVDATGIGAGLAAFLEKSLPRKVRPFVFSAVSKSALGWNFLSLVDSGRYQEYYPDGADDTNWFWRQLEAVEYAVQNGPGKLLRWSVPDPNLHDDLVMSAALAALLDDLNWKPRHANGVS